MFTGSAELYDFLDSKFCDYRAQALALNRLIEKFHPAAASLLLLPCGTGQLAGELTESYGYRVDGIDECEARIRRAANKTPAGRFTCGDLTAFETEKPYDVIILNAAVFATLDKIEKIYDLLCNARESLAGNGLLILEPWQAPPEWHRGHMQLKTLETAGYSITRISYCENNRTTSHIHHEYILSSPEGVLESTEIIEMHCFPSELLEICFERADFSVEKYPDTPESTPCFVIRPERYFPELSQNSLQRKSRFPAAV